MLLMPKVLSLIDLAHYMPMSCRQVTVHMTDLDFIRLSALVFATRLIGVAEDPVSEGVEMAERLFGRLQEREEQ